MNAYSILGIPDNSDLPTIKKAYKKLALKYHPDKNKDDTSEQFMKINVAYNLLVDGGNKKKYDNLDTAGQQSMYDYLFKHMCDQSPDWLKICKDILDDVYDDKETMKTDVDNLDIISVFKKIYYKMYINKNKWVNDDNIIFMMYNDCKIINGKNDKTKIIKVNINTTILEKYKNTFRMIVIYDHYDDKYISAIVPLREEEIIYSQYAVINKQMHDIEIKTVVDDTKFVIVDNDLFINIDISLSQYLYGGHIYFEHVDEESIKITFDPCHNNKSYAVIKGKGLPYTQEPENSDDEYIDITNNMLDIGYGDLYIYFNIYNPNPERMKKIITRLFPPIDVIRCK